MSKNSSRRTGRVGRIVKTTVSVIAAVGFLAAGTAIGGFSNKMVGSIAGLYSHTVDNSRADTSGVNLNYYTAQHTKENIRAAEDDLANRIAGEGTVLLKNDDNTLPMKKGTKVSFFSINSGTRQAMDVGIFTPWYLSLAVLVEEVCKQSLSLQVLKLITLYGIFIIQMKRRTTV